MTYHVPGAVTTTPPAPKIEITPEMIAAGRDALWCIPGNGYLLECGGLTAADVSEAILRAALEVYCFQNLADASKTVQMSDRPIASAAEQMAELRKLAELQNFDLFVFLRELTQLGAVTLRAKVNPATTIGTEGPAFIDELGEGVLALLAALRARHVSADEIERRSSVGHVDAPEFRVTTDSRRLIIRGKEGEVLRLQALEVPENVVLVAVDTGSPAYRIGIEPQEQPLPQNERVSGPETDRPTRQLDSRNRSSGTHSTNLPA